MDMLYYINRLNEGEKMLTSEFARHERQKTKNMEIYILGEGKQIKASFSEKIVRILSSAIMRT